MFRKRNKVPIIRLTPQGTRPREMADRPARSEAESSETEIEVTPEMVAAGVRALCEYDPYFKTQEQGAVSIFRAMVAAHDRAASPTVRSDREPPLSTETASWPERN